MRRLLIILAFLPILANAQYTMTIRPGECDGKDASIRDDYPNRNYWFDVNMIANAWTASGFYFLQRSYLEFDLNVLPEDAIITSVKLSLYCNTTSGHHQLNSGENETYLYRITEAWDEREISWNNQPDYTGENSYLLKKSDSTTQNYEDIDITAMALDAVVENNGLLGIMMQLKMEQTFRCMVFASSDHPDSSIRPKLTVNYDCSAPVANFNYSIQEDFVEFYSTSTGADSWDWIFSNGYYSTLENPIINYDVAGEIIACLTVNNGCTFDKKCDTVNTNLIIHKNLSTNNLLKVYPNPATELINIRNEGNKTLKKLSLIIYDELGSQRFKTGLSKISPHQTKVIDVPNCKKGIYYLRVAGDEIYETHKLLIK